MSQQLMNEEEGGRCKRWESCLVEVNLRVGNGVINVTLES